LPSPKHASARPSSRLQRWAAAAGALAVLAGVLSAVVAFSWRSSDSNGLPGPARADVQAFFGRYMEPHGRVVRRDQGDDTVSEAQAYALLLAVAAGDRDRFARVWGWTDSHLRRADGLLAWRWANGRVVDATPAADADLDTAWALALAAARFGNPTYAESARNMAGSILREETVPTSLGPVLVAGPWARGTSASVVDPSYFSPPAYSALAQLTNDGRWSRLAETSVAVLRQLTASPARLPPDWATVTSQGRAADSPGPNGAPTAVYGLDAARSEVWYGVACAPGERALSAAAWRLLAPGAASFDSALTHSLQGVPRSSGRSPLIAVADAASAGSSGQPDKVLRLLARSDDLAARYHTYYGTAWAALGRVLLTTTALGGCAKK
jgi:hypothetical protein